MSTTLETILLYPKAKYQTIHGTPCEVVGFDFREDYCVYIEHLGADGDWARSWVSPSSIKPVLRSFADLCTPLEDGTVPARHIASLLANDWAARYSTSIHEVRGNRVTVRLMQWNDEEGEILVGDISILADWNFHLDDEGEILHFENVLEAYDYLRSKHFALPVNGKPLVEGTHYIRKGQPDA